MTNTKEEILEKEIERKVFRLNEQNRFIGYSKGFDEGKQAGISQTKEKVLEIIKKLDNNIKDYLVDGERYKELKQVVKEL